MNTGDFHPFPGQHGRSDDAIENEAAEWLAFRTSRKLTREEQQRLEAWLAADPRHASILKDLEATWRALDALEAYPRPKHAPVDPDFLAPRRRARVLPWAVLAAAAAIALIFRVAPWSDGARTPQTAPVAQHPVPAPAEPRVSIFAAADSARLVRLPDGSVAQLRAGSELAQQYVSGERRVRVVRGEAFFSVAKDATRPFVVEAGGVLVRALGTAFNVQLEQGSVVVLVTEGNVNVRPAAAAEAAVEAQLGAGQLAVVNTGQVAGPAVQDVSTAYIEQSLGWQGGNLVFDGTPLSDVIVLFNERNARQLVINDATLGAMRISGRFRAENVESFAELLESGFGIAVERRGNEIILARER